MHFHVSLARVIENSENSNTDVVDAEYSRDLEGYNYDLSIR